MPVARRPIGVALRERLIVHIVEERVVAPCAVFDPPPDLPTGTRLNPPEERDAICYAGALDLELHSGEAGHYRDNLVSGAPRIWVALKPADQDFELALISVNPYEGEALASSIGIVCESLPLPPALADWMQAFMADYPQEEAFVKRRRDKRKGEGRDKPGGTR